MDVKTIQRTVVLTCGRLAQTAAAVLAAKLAEPGEPGAAVALVDGAGGDPAAKVREAVAAVSRTDARAVLARDGRRFDRLDELSIVALIDAADCDLKAVAATVGAARTAARGMLGIDAGALLIALVPTLEDEAAQDRLRKAMTNFDRGAIVLGRVTQDGLWLADEEMLTAAAATLTHALITTPLRDAPDGATLALGVAQWRRPGEEVWTALARRWAVEAIRRWLEPAGDAPDTQSMGLIDRSSLSPERLTMAVKAILPPHPVPVWSPPQPWDMRHDLERIASLAAALTIPSAESIAWVEEDLAPIGDSLAGTVEEKCRETLDERAVGSMAQVIRWVQGVEVELRRLADGVAGRQEREDVTAVELAQREAFLMAEMSHLLAGWPADGGRAWASALWRVWRWPALALRYRQLHQLGQSLRELTEARTQLEQRQVITIALLRQYEACGRRVECLASRVEELKDMLEFTARQLAMEEAPFVAASPVDPDALYERLMESAPAEAERAAAAVGGLGRHLAALEDVGETLIAAGRERLAEGRALPAVAMLRLATEVGLDTAAWWAALWAEAAPLWPGGDARNGDVPPERLYVLAKDVGGLRDLPGLPEAAEWRWIDVDERCRDVPPERLYGR